MRRLSRNDDKSSVWYGAYRIGVARIPLCCVRTRTKTPARIQFHHVYQSPSGSRPNVAARARLSRRRIGGVGAQLPDHETSADGVAAAVLARPVRHRRRRSTRIDCGCTAAATERAAADVAAAVTGLDAANRRLDRIHGACPALA